MSNNIPFMFPNGILNGSNPNPTYGYNVGAPVLATGPQPLQPALSGPTGNARGSSRMPQYPNNKINMMGEGLMRMGGSALSAINDGPVAQLGAMFNTYGDVRDYNRAQDLAQYQAEEDRRLEEQRRQDLLRKVSGSGGNKGAGDPEAVGEVRSAIAKLQSARDMFTNDPDSSLTGFNWTAIASRLTGRAVGNEDEAKRLFLQEVRLDSVMQRVAQTKGAISNAEMQLFASQAPTLDSNDVVWKAWLDRQLLLQKKILNRLQNGIQVDPDAPLDDDLADPNTSTVDQSVIDEANAVINGG